MKKITILCSGFGLGFYIPGVLLKNEFSNMGYDAEVDVFESYMEDSQQDHIDDSKKEYHDNFSKAIIASKLPLNSEKSIDYDKVDLLINKWKSEGRQDFISLSGHWIYILEKFRKTVDWNIRVDGLYVDADLAPSWKSLRKYLDHFEDRYVPVCLYNKEELVMKYSLGTTLFEALPYEKRENSVVIHGGGWGMGTYRETVNDLCEQTSLHIALIAYNEMEMEPSDRITTYMNDVNWCAWKQKEKCGFPTYIMKQKQGEVEHKLFDRPYHWLLEITSRQKAIIAKPGAGTLIDSFITETPIILLKPFGSHEQKNLEVWKNLGFGILFDEWQTTNFDMEVLKEAHQNIKDYKSMVIGYAESYIKRVISV